MPIGEDPNLIVEKKPIVYKRVETQIKREKNRLELDKLMKERQDLENPHLTLIEREKIKQTQQIENRQQATGIMSDFLEALKGLAKNPERLSELKISLPQIYKIIREEEDRASLLRLKERAENRADAQFAFIISLARAGQLMEEDIEFLEADTKAELKTFKKSNGVYELINPLGVAALQSPAKDSDTLAG